MKTRGLLGKALLIATALTIARAAPAGAVTVVHTNDIMGELEPCGCRKNPLGGVAREANLLKKYKSQDPIRLDAGDLLFPTDIAPPLLAAQSKLQAEYLLKSMQLLHYDAVVPGEKDFALGVKVFDQLRRKFPAIHFLAANLARRDGKNPFERHLIFTRKDAEGHTVRVGVFGIVGEDLSWPKQLKASSATKVAKVEAGELRKKVDVLIALTHEGYEKDQALAKAVPGIDLIIGGHTQAFLQEPPTVAKTKIYQSSFRNQYVGLIPIEKPFTGNGYQLVGLDAGYDSPAGAPGAMDDLVKEFKKAIAELNSREEARMVAQASAEDTSENKPGKYQTFPKCAECHLKQFDFWRKTPHALALDPLMEKDQFMNKECLTCHTVGLGDPQGFGTVGHLAESKMGDGKIDRIETKNLNAYLKAMHDANSLETPVKLVTGDSEPRALRLSISAIHRSWTPVQCENCHQPGKDHPFSVGYAKRVESATCLKCHTAERAPEWYTKSGEPDMQVVERKRALVTCPAGD